MSHEYEPDRTLSHILKPAKLDPTPEAQPAGLAIPQQVRAAPVAAPQGAVLDVTKDGLADDEAIEANNVVSSLRHAQHLLDKSSNSDDASALFDRLVGVKSHLAHVKDSASTYAGKYGVRKVMHHLDALDVAIDSFATRVGAKGTELKPWLELHDDNQRVRKQLGASKSAPDAVKPTKELAPDGSYAVASLRDTFDLIASRSRELQMHLDADVDGRDKAHRIDTLVPSLAHAAVVLRELDPKERPQVKDRANRAANRVAHLLQWARESPNTRTFQDAFAPVVGKMDGVLATLELPQVEDRAVAFTARATAEMKRENTELEKAEFDLNDRLGKREFDWMQGVERFDKIAKLIDPAKTPSLLESVAGALFQAAAGHVAGALVGALLTGATNLKARGNIAVASAGAAAQSDKNGGLISKIADVTTDTVQGLLGNSSEGRAEIAKARDMEKSRIYFVESQKKSAHAFGTMARTTTREQVRNQETTAAEIDALRNTFANIKNLTDVVYENTAKAWAMYVAQQQLGSDPWNMLDGVPPTSNMDDYYGKFGGYGKASKPTRAGGAGVLQLEFRVTGRNGGKGQIRLGECRIVGLNKELTDTILKDARGEGRLANVALPKELIIEPGFSGSRDWRAAIALDERNRFRDQHGWKTLVDVADLENDPDYATPEAFCANVFPALRAPG